MLPLGREVPGADGSSEHEIREVNEELDDPQQAEKVHGNGVVVARVALQEFVRFRVAVGHEEEEEVLELALHCKQLG